VNGLDYLRRRATGSHLRRDFARLFWQYVRIRGRTYRYVVQDPGVCGLDWFSQRYLRMTGLRDGMGEGVQLDSALALESRDVRLHSLEVRTSPEARWMRNRDLCRAVRSATVQGRTFKSDHLPGEIGLVLHFVKQPIDARGRCHGDPRAHHCRYGSYFRARRQEALAIVGCLRREPKLLRWLRGIDVCNLEISIPSWVIGPLFALVRQETDTIAAHSGEPELRATLHAGEEYTRLISGIRQVHEPLEFGTVRRGDRLGHALALGEDARSWAARSPVVVQRVEERLDDLLWELDRYQSGDLPAQAGRLEVVRTEICRLASVIFGAFSPRDERVLLAWRRRMHCWHALQTLRYPSVAAGTLPISADGAMKLLHAYLTDVGVYARSRQVLEVRPTEDEILVCTAAQRFLRQRLADFDISIEINPTSNLLIGNLRELDHHPIFQLQPLSGVPDDGEAPVRVVLGDDDPVTFSTTLVDEFAYVYFGLLRHGVGTQRAEQWLERVRLNGRRARFTIPLPRAGQVGEKSFT